MHLAHAYSGNSLEQRSGALVGREGAVSSEQKAWKDAVRLLRKS